MKTACLTRAPVTAAVRAGVRPPGVARLLLPREHGSWALAFEPLALGLLAAPSLAGVALGAAVGAAFFARRPCKLALSAGDPAERALASRLLAWLAAVAAAGLGVAAVLGGVSALWPLLAALPCAAVFLTFDLRDDARAGVAEIAGAAAFACVPGALAVLAGWPAPLALALTLVMLVRAVPTVLVVRACLRQRKGRPAAPLWALASAWAGAALVAGLVWQGFGGWVPAALALGLAVRATWLLGPQPPTWSARRLGIFEVVVGAVYVVIAGMTF